MQCRECQRLIENDPMIDRNQAKAKLVVAFTAVTMVVEITAGYWTKSMALLAEGWHMTTHFGAMLIALVVYQLIRSPKISSQFSFGAGKLIPLGGYTSAVALAVVALMIFAESLVRLFSAPHVHYNEALAVACLGLVVNIISAVILNEGHHDHHSHDHDHNHDHHHNHTDHHIQDHNIRSAFLHVIADALTGVLAIAALLVGKYYHWLWMDPVVGMIAALVILGWAYHLCRDSGSELLDAHSKAVDMHKLKRLVETGSTKIIDFHAWRIAPKAIACELVVSTSDLRGPEHYRDLLRDEFGVQHVVVEEQLL